MLKDHKDIIEVEEAGSLYGLLLERVKRSPDATAYRYFDNVTERWLSITWSALALELGRWQVALRSEGLTAGDRVGIMMGSCVEWVLFEQAALGLGLVVIPLYANDRADNVAYIIRDANIKILLIGGAEQWQVIKTAQAEVGGLQRLLTLNECADASLSNYCMVRAWLNEESELAPKPASVLDELATIVYTSGTTGRPKGVMLSHRNVLWNARSPLDIVDIYPSDEFLSFLPLSHTLERTVGYYLAMMAGAQVAYARSIPHLAEDLVALQPTVIISVPRIFERVLLKVKSKLADQGKIAQWLFSSAVDVGWRRFLYHQGRSPWHPSFLFWPIFKKLVADKLMEKFGGRIRVAVCGGAPLSEDIAKVFIGLGLPIIQGYGLTETSPVISVNTLEINYPASVGMALPGVAVKVDDKDQLLTRSPAVMLGYWNNPQATAEMIDGQGWLNTGDKARIDGKQIYITGRTKDIIVLANGEKVPPADMEAAIMLDSLFEQALVVGEGKAFLSALVVLNAELKDKLFATLARDGEDKLKKALLARMTARLKDFPGYAQVRAVLVIKEPWTVENELLTPTLKVKRGRVLEKYAAEVAALYEGH